MPSLLVAKFIPGFSTVAPPLAGPRRALLDFSPHDSGAPCCGRSGRRHGDGVPPRDRPRPPLLASLGSGAFVLLAAGLVVFIAFKWWQRRRFYKVLRMARHLGRGAPPPDEDGEKPLPSSTCAPGRPAGIRARLPGPSSWDFGLGRAPLRASAKPRGDPLLHVTPRGHGRPCGAHADQQEVHACPAARRRTRGLGGGGYPIDAEPLVRIGDQEDMPRPRRDTVSLEGPRRRGPSVFAGGRRATWPSCRRPSTSTVGHAHAVIRS